MATSAPVPSDAPFCSAAIIRTTAGWGICAAGAADDGQPMATAEASAIRIARGVFTRVQSIGKRDNEPLSCSSAIGSLNVQQSDNGRKVW